MNFKIIKQLYKKEILDVLRDKKTVIMMLIVPLLVYPLMFVAGMGMMSKVTTEMNTQTYTIGVNFMESDTELLELFLDSGDDTIRFELEDSRVRDADYSVILRGEHIDAFVDRVDTESGVRFCVTYMSSVTNSSYAMQKIEQVLQRYAEQITRQTISDAGMDAETVLNPIDVEIRDCASTEESTGSMLGVIVPFMLVVSLLMGTMYPAIDTTAGERERGTLETILTLPVTNQELIFSKFLTVGTIGIVSAVLNLISMGGIGVYVYKLMVETGGVLQEFDWKRFLPVIVICVLCILAFAVLISALSMCFCVFAKSYKEANNYITPLMLVVMFASFVAFMPNVTLTNRMALVPVVNICLLIRDLLAFKFSLSAIVIVLLGNVIYGVLAVLLLGKLYNSEAVLFGDSMEGVRIFERRSNLVKGGVPSFGDVLVALAVVLVLMIYAGGYASAKNIFSGLLVTQGIVAFVPLLIAWYTKRDTRKTFRLRGCHLGYFLGGWLLMCGVILLGMLLTAVTSQLFPESADSMNGSLDVVFQKGYGVSLLVIALLPAVCEELLFRGFLLSSLEQRLKRKSAILVAALLFGLYHMNLVQSPTTALIGAALCYVAVQANSLFPGILMHFFNNALSVTASFYPEKLERILPFLSENGMPVLVVLLLGVVLTGIGVYCVKLTKKRTDVVERSKN